MSKLPKAQETDWYTEFLYQYQVGLKPDTVTAAPASTITPVWTPGTIVLVNAPRSSGKSLIFNWMDFGFPTTYKKKKKTPDWYPAMIGDPRDEAYGIVEKLSNKLNVFQQLGLIGLFDVMLDNPIFKKNVASISHTDSYMSAHHILIQFVKADFDFTITVFETAISFHIGSSYYSSNQKDGEYDFTKIKSEIYRHMLDLKNKIASRHRPENGWDTSALFKSV